MRIHQYPNVPIKDAIVSVRSRQNDSMTTGFLRWSNMRNPHDVETVKHVPKEECMTSYAQLSRIAVLFITSENPFPIMASHWFVAFSTGNGWVENIGLEKKVAAYIIIRKNAIELDEKYDAYVVLMCESEFGSII